MGVNMGSVLRREPLELVGGDGPAMESVVAKVTIRINVSVYMFPEGADGADRVIAIRS